VNLGATVAEAALRFGDAPALRRPDGTDVSYVELDRWSDEVASGLSHRGVVEHDRVALVLPSGVDYVVVYAALSKLGAATAGVNPRLTAPERAALVTLVEPHRVVTTEALAAGLEDRPPLDVIASWRDLAGVAPPPPPVDPDPDRLAALVFTSGTTGQGRAAVFTEAQIAAITASDIGDQWGGGGPMLASTAFAHVGFMTKLSWYLRLGGVVCLLDGWRANDVLATIATNRITSLGGVAPQLALLLACPTFDAHDLSCVTTIVMGGAPSPPALVVEATTRLHAGYSIRYSSTESGGVGTATAFDVLDLETVGRPRDGVEVRIVDGEVCLRSACMATGYWGDPDATATTWRDGWLHTGDLGSLTSDGRLVLLGRAKEMYLRGGYNVYPQEIEAVLASHPQVDAIAIVPVAHPLLGEIGEAVVVSDDPPTLDDLRSFAADRLAQWKLPERMRLVQEIPLTPMHKVDRRRLTSDSVAHLEH